MDKELCEYILNKHNIKLDQYFKWKMSNVLYKCQIKQDNYRYDLLINDSKAPIDHCISIASGIGEISFYDFVPKIGEEYWFVAFDGLIGKSTLCYADEHAYRLQKLNYYKTYEEAALDTIKSYIIQRDYDVIFKKSKVEKADV